MIPDLRLINRGHGMPENSAKSLAKRFTIGGTELLAFLLDEALQRTKKSPRVTQVPPFDERILSIGTGSRYTEVT